MKAKSPITKDKKSDKKKVLPIKKKGNNRSVSSPQSKKEEEQQQQQQQPQQIKKNKSLSTKKEKTNSVISKEIKEIESDKSEEILNKNESEIKNTLNNEEIKQDQQEQQQRCDNKNEGQVEQKQMTGIFESPPASVKRREKLSEWSSTTTTCTKEGRSTRNTAITATDSKCISSNKTTPYIKSPKHNKRHHRDEQCHDDLEPALRKQIYQSFMENLQKIEEPESYSENMIDEENEYDYLKQQKKSRNPYSDIEHENEQSQSRVVIQKINFNGFSNLSEYDQSSSEDLLSEEKNKQKKSQGNKNVTLIFKRQQELKERSSIKDVLDGNCESIQNGNLLISISNTDEDYPGVLYNQNYIHNENPQKKQIQSSIKQAKRRVIQLDCVNSIGIDKENGLCNLLDECVMEYEQGLRAPNQVKEQVKCNCKKSKCLKLYCDCFNLGQLCSSLCNCVSCSNHQDNPQRTAAVNLLKQRNPHAFQPKILVQEDQDVMVHKKGCNCKKSGCEKKYCECYNTGVKCTDQCRCEGCKNIDLPPSNNHPNYPDQRSIPFNPTHIQPNNKLNYHYPPAHNHSNNEEMVMYNSHNIMHHSYPPRPIFRHSHDENMIHNYPPHLKKFNMSEFNANIPMRMNQSSLEQQRSFYQKMKIMPIPHIGFYSDEEYCHNQIPYPPHMRNHIGRPYGNIMGGYNPKIKESYYDDYHNDKPHMEKYATSVERNNNSNYKNKINTSSSTVDISLQNGQIKNIQSKQK